MANIDQSSFVQLMSDVVKKALSVSLDEFEDFTHTHFLTIEDVILNEVGITCSHATIKKYVKKAVNRDTSGLAPSTLEVFSFYVLKDMHRSKIRTGSISNWIMYKRLKSGNYSGLRKRKPILIMIFIFSAFLLAMILTNKIPFTPTKTNGRVNIAIAINTHDNEYFEWLKDTFEHSCNCNLSYDRNLKKVDSRSSRERVKSFYQSDTIDVIFGGSVGIHADKTINEKYLVLKSLIDTARVKGIPYDESDQKWIAIYQKYLGVAWKKSSKIKAPPNSLQKIISAMSSDSAFFLIPPAVPNSSLPHSFILSLSADGTNYNFIKGEKGYRNLLSNKNCLYNQKKKFDNLQCLFNQTNADITLVQSHDAIKHIREDSLQNKIGISLLEESVPTISCISILNNKRNKECAKEFVKFVLSKNAQTMLYDKTMKIPTSTESQKEIKGLWSEEIAPKSISFKVIEKRSEANIPANNVLQTLSRDISSDKLPANKLRVLKNTCK